MQSPPSTSACESPHHDRAKPAGSAASPANASPSAPHEAQAFADVQRWLSRYCERSADVAGGLVIATGAGKVAQTVAKWPVTHETSPLLATAAAAAARRNRTTILQAAASEADADSVHSHAISLPLRHDERTLGAVALSVRANDGKALDALVTHLKNATAEIGHRLAGSAVRTEGDTGWAPQLLQLQDALLRHPTLADGSLALVTEMSSVLECDTVGLGVVAAGELAVIALSNQAEVHAGQGLQRLQAAAMLEAVDQGAGVVYPAPPTGAVRIVQAHAALHARSAHVLASVVLVHRRRAVGALLAQWPAAAPPDAARLALLERLARAIGPQIGLSLLAERSWSERTAEAWRAARRRVTRRGDPIPKVLAAALLLALVAAAWLPVPYRVVAPARIEGAVQRSVVALLDGFLLKSHVRPADVVRAGDVLIELASQELLLEEGRWQATLTQHENAHAAALARADRAQYVIALGKAGEARAQLELLRQQLARTRLLAPIDGVVIKGDLSQNIGGPVKRGDALLTIAPADRYRLFVDVDERDIASVKPGLTGKLALASRPSEPLPFIVERVTPVAAVRDGRNAFEVEARLLSHESAQNPLRPGLQGVAKIDAGRQSFAWILTHRFADWLRLALWSWGG